MIAESYKTDSQVKTAFTNIYVHYIYLFIHKKYKTHFLFKSNVQGIYHFIVTVCCHLGCFKYMLLQGSLLLYAYATD